MPARGANSQPPLEGAKHSPSPAGPTNLTRSTTRACSSNNRASRATVSLAPALHKALPCARQTALCTRGCRHATVRRQTSYTVPQSPVTFTLVLCIYNSGLQTRPCTFSRNCVANIPATQCLSPVTSHITLVRAYTIRVYNPCTFPCNCVANIPATQCPILCVYFSRA